jgi:hypothetical protein
MYTIYCKKLVEFECSMKTMMRELAVFQNGNGGFVFVVCHFLFLLFPLLGKCRSDKTCGIRVLLLVYILPPV